MIEAHAAGSERELAATAVGTAGRGAEAAGGT